MKTVLALAVLLSQSPVQAQPGAPGTDVSTATLPSGPTPEVGTAVGMTASTSAVAASSAPFKRDETKLHGTLVHWLGQAAFLVTSPGGKRVLMDPLGPDVGYKLPAPIGVDFVTVSHEHGDHNNVSLATGTFKLLRGLDGKDFKKHDVKSGDMRIRSVSTFHDGKKGKERGRNAVFVVEAGDIKVAHLGDLGQVPDEKQLKEIGPVDVLLLPVGGFYTIDAAKAHEVSALIKPARAIVPMHYKTPSSKVENLAPVDEFLKLRNPLTPNVQREGSPYFMLNRETAPKKPEDKTPELKIIVLTPP